MRVSTAPRVIVVLFLLVAGSGCGSDPDAVGEPTVVSTSITPTSDAPVTTDTQGSPSTTGPDSTGPDPTGPASTGPITGPESTGPDTTDDAGERTVVSEIDSIEQRWASTWGDSYSYHLRYWDGVQRERGCGLADARIVVVDGEVIDAVGLPVSDEPACRLDPADVPSIEELFDVARSTARTDDLVLGDIADESTILTAYVEGGDAAMQLMIGDMSRSVAPTAIGWEEVRQAATSARTRWSDQTYDHEVWISTSAYAPDNDARVTTVVDGEPVKVVEGGQEIDPDTLSGNWGPLTVEDLFSTIDKFDGDGYVAAVFDPDTGVPTQLWFNPLPKAVDDEFVLTAKVRPL